jgi:hypothetical protein
VLLNEDHIKRARFIREQIPAGGLFAGLELCLKTPLASFAQER